MLTTTELQSAVNENCYPPADVTGGTYVAWREEKFLTDLRLEAEWTEWLNHTYLPDATDDIRYAVMCQAQDVEQGGLTYAEIEERFKHIAGLVKAGEQIG